jgi:hypothetical protein
MVQAERNVSEFAISFDDNVHPDSFVELELQGDHLDQMRLKGAALSRPAVNESA